MLLSNDKATSGTVKYVLVWYGLIVTWSSGDVGMVGLVSVCGGNCLGVGWMWGQARFDIVYMYGERMISKPC